jgi:hypothetical protein
MQTVGDRRVEFRDHGPETGQSPGQFAGVGVSGLAALRGRGNLVDGCPEHGKPDLQSRTHDRILGRRRHDRDAFRPRGTTCFAAMIVPAPVPAWTRATRRAGLLAGPRCGATRRPGKRITTFHLWTTLRRVWTI